jgi:NOL1/NOP2/fmu family ribosome biogenesis protein
MVVDAPCSGEGLFRKDLQAMEEWSPQNVALCSSRQKRILADVWPALRENGILVYCTCTYNEPENEENLLWLQQQHEVEFLQLQLQPEWNIEEIRQGKITGYRFFPHRVKGEGFFISVIRKKETQQSHRVKAKTKEFLPTKKLAESVTPWIRPSHASIILQHQDDLYFLPEEKFTEAGMLYQHLRIVTSGTSLASIKQNKLIPAHTLAMSIYLEQAIFPSVAVDRESAIRYLRRDSGPLDLAEAERGFHLIRFENTALGWINNIGNRYNNLYPQEWRIRMAPR